MAWVNHRCLQMFLNVCPFNTHCKLSPVIALVKNIGVCGGIFIETESYSLLFTHQNMRAFCGQACPTLSVTVPLHLKRHWRSLKCTDALENGLITKRELRQPHTPLSFNSVSRTRNESNNSFPTSDFSQSKERNAKHSHPM